MILETEFIMTETYGFTCHGVEVPSKSISQLGAAVDIAGPALIPISQGNQVQTIYFGPDLPYISIY